MNAHATRGGRRFIDAVADIAHDPNTVRSLHAGDLLVLEALLCVILETVTTELKRRDRERRMGVQESPAIYGVPVAG
ncbi:MAG: hypothetical protein DIU71_04060 [Proteobacteria bacterium]|nr:MAG: hypothetical protein DIU71_04060 [Pseudomonadota bacterium]